MSSSQGSKPLWLFLAALLLVAIGVAGFVGLGTGGQADLPVYGEVPAALFTSHTNEQVNLADLQGDVWVGDLIFTTCSGPCLRMTSSMYTLQEDLKGEDRFRLVSISVDPDRDTPERLAWYAEQTQADDERWSFLTAGMDVVRPMAIEGLKLVVDHGVEGEEFGILHSDRFVLVDGAGQIRGYYDGMDPAAMDQLKKDARSLLRSL
jgi:protein SCO1/2